MASVMASAAQWERRIISERTKDALASRKAAGVHIGRSSSLDAATRDLICALRATGNSCRQIADTLNNQGVATGQGASSWHPSSVRHVFLSAEARFTLPPSRP